MLPVGKNSACLFVDVVISLHRLKEGGLYVMLMLFLLLRRVSLRKVLHLWKDWALVTVVP